MIQVPLGCVTIALLAGCFGGCSKRDPTPTIDANEPDPGDGRREVSAFPTTLNRNLDLLLVVDDSSTMTEKQIALANNLPVVIEWLTRVPGGLPDVHIGVVSSDMGTKPRSAEQPALAIGQVGEGGCAQNGKGGALQTNGFDVSGAFLRDVKQPDGTRLRNYTGNLATTLGGMVRIGDGGCGFEQHLFAMHAALDNHPANAGFRRADANLAVLVFADEDDCSAKRAAFFSADTSQLGPLESFRCFRWGVDCDGEETALGTKANCKPDEESMYLDGVSTYADFLRSKVGDPRQLVFDVIGGAASPIVVVQGMSPNQGPAVASSCTGNVIAFPPIRLGALASELGGVRGNLCSPNISDALGAFGQRIVRMIGTPCVQHEIADADPASAGLQPDCIVYDEANGTRTELAACGDTPVAPCWRFVIDVMNCPASPDMLSLHIERDSAPSPSTWTYARCK